MLEARTQEFNKFLFGHFASGLDRVAGEIELAKIREIRVKKHFPVGLGCRAARY